MATITIEVPDKYKEFLNDSSEFQSIITERMYDYIEYKQDKITKNKLQNNPYFHQLNNSLEEKLGKL